MKLSKEIVRELYCACAGDVFEEEGFTVIESEDWVCSGKYEYSSVIFEAGPEFESGNRQAYCLDLSRSGSYFTDYTYGYEFSNDFEAYPVVKKEKIVTEWVRM